jgi:capsular exopolysaccharide synthesis family protein
MEEQISSNKNELWSLSVKDLFYKYVRFLPLFLLSVAFALLVAFIYLRYATRIYDANGTMQIKNLQQSNQNNDKVEDLLSGNNRSQSIQNEIEVLKSRPLMARVVRRLNLEYSYTAKGKIKDFNIYKQAPFALKTYELNDPDRAFSLNVKFLSDSKFKINDEASTFAFNNIFKNEFGVFSLEKTGVAAANTEFVVTYSPTEAVASALVSGVRVQPKTPGTSILLISLQSTNAAQAADIINSLMVQYDSLTIEQNNFSTDQTMNFIDDRLDTLKNELDDLQVIELATRQKGKLFDIELQSTQYFDKMSESDKAISEQEMRINVADMVRDYVSTADHKFNLVPSSLGLEDATLIELVAAYNRAQMERQTLLNSNIPPANPAVKEAEMIIEKQRQNLVENLKNIKLSYVANIGNLRRKNLSQEHQIEAMPEKIKDLLEIQRQISTKLELYNLLEQKKEEAAISRASTISNSKILDKAQVNTTPVKPSRRTVQILAILIGLGLPALAIFMIEVLNDKINTRHDIERITKAPILGEIGHSYSEDVLVVSKTSRSMVAEQFRIIRSNLQYVLTGSENGVILVTSSFSGEGKSYISTNIGAVVALTGKKTIILELDIRKPKVLSGLKISKQRQGVSNYLVGKAELSELIIPVPNHENLYILPCGPIPPNPSELLLDNKVAEMFKWLRANFDMIVVDTAPVGMVSDAMTLGKFADCTLYLVRQGYTYKKQVALIDELHQSTKLPAVSIVINDVKSKAGYGYYGYGRYGYGYGYGNKKSDTYFSEETAPPNFLDRLLHRLDFRRWFRRKK